MEAQTWEAPARRARAGSLIPDLTELEAIGYERVSMVGGRGGESYISREVQREEIQFKAAQIGCKALVGWYGEEDVSGRSMDRPEFEKVMAAVAAASAAGQPLIVIVARVDRFGRNTLGGLAEYDAIAEAGGLLVAGDVPIYPGMRRSHYREQITRKLVEGEAQSDRIAENWEAAVTKAITRGTYPGNKPPLGYQWEREFDEGREPHQRKSHKLVIAEGLREPVRGLFLGRAAGKAWTTLAEEFEAATGISVHPQSLNRIIENRAYRGELHYKGFDPNLKAHEALVTEKEWQAAQSKHVRPARPANRKGESIALLSGGVLRCAACGRVMAYRGGAGKQYTCTRVGYGLPECKLKENGQGPALISAARLEGHVHGLVRERLEGIIAHGVPAGGDRFDALDEAVAAAEENYALWQEHNSIGESGIDAYNRGKRSELGKIAAAKAARERELAGIGDIDEEFIALARLYDELPVEHQRRVVTRLIDKVEVHRAPPRVKGQSTTVPIEERVTVYWNEALASIGGAGRARA